MAKRPELAQAVCEGAPYLAAEVVYACSHEGALHLDDVLARRTRLALEVADRGKAVAGRVAELMATELGWSETQWCFEADHYRQTARAKLAAEAAPDDRRAAECRLSVPDIAGFYD
jgi:glycerol-3-phosphate dehydrogenase